MVSSLAEAIRGRETDDWPYAAGLRLLESCRLRIKDIDFERWQILICDGKGHKDRHVPPPERLHEGLQRQMNSALVQSGEELGAGVV